MPRTLVQRICNSMLVVALCVTFVGVALVFGQSHLKSLPQAVEIPRASGSYGELPPAW
jgi:hypothetical protein